jgi:hypothetical protein
MERVHRQSSLLCWRLEVDVVAGATHPTVHPRGLLRRPEFREAIRRHVAR